MALNEVTFNRSQAGLGRPLANNDHISGMLFYTGGSLPSGFASGDRIKKIFSVKDAENLGILDDHADETVGTGGQVTITGTWLVGEIIRIEVGGASIGQFTLTATTITSAVAGLVAAINAGTSTGIKHGWVAVDNDPVVELTQPAKLGIVNESGTPIVFVDRNATDTAASAGGTSTDVQPSSGAGSYFAAMHYHISEYFRMQPKGVLYVGIYAQGTYAGTELQTIQNYAAGTIRQCGVYLSHETYAASHTTTTQADLDTLEAEFMPMSVVLHADMSATTVSALATLATLSNERVSVTAGEDGNWHQPAWVNTKAYTAGTKVVFQGKTYQARKYIAVASPGDNPGPYDSTAWTDLGINLPDVLGFSVSTMGLTLGAVAAAKVHENIAWPQKFDLVNGTALDEVGFATGQLWKDISVSARNTLNNYHYIFLRKIQDAAGTFFNDSWTAIAETNDFATIENVRVMDKATRGIRLNMVPNIASPIYVNADGTLTEDTIAKFENDCDKALEAMLKDGELSAKSVTINPAQDVLSTSTIEIAVVLVPVGTARNIEINIGYAVKIAA